jgi:hypothetical protein
MRLLTGSPLSIIIYSRKVAKQQRKSKSEPQRHGNTIFLLSLFEMGFLTGWGSAWTGGKTQVILACLGNFSDSTAPSVPLSDLTGRLCSSGFEQHFGQNEFRKNAPVHHAGFAALFYEAQK